MAAHGMSICIPENGSKVVEVFMKYGNKIDLVILAMVMPKMGDRKPTWN
jgi:hypothetical protein